MTKILFASQRYGIDVVGGSEFSTRQFAERLVQWGHEVTVLTTCALSYVSWENHFPEGWQEINGVSVVRLPVSNPRAQTVFEPLHSQVLTRKAMPYVEQQAWANQIGPSPQAYRSTLLSLSNHTDFVVFKSYLYSTATTGIPLIARRRPTIFNPELHPEEMIDLTLYDFLFRLPDAFQVGTPEEAFLLQQRFGISQDTCFEVGVGVDPPITDPEVRSDITFLRDRDFLLVIGRYSEGKGSPKIVSYWSQAMAAGTIDVELVFIGEAPVGDKSKNERLHFVGLVSEDEKQWLAARALAVIQGSDLESFSIVLIEAWNVGTPVISIGQSAVVRGQMFRAAAGLSVKDVSEFTAAIKLCMNPQSRTVLGDAGRQYVELRYRWPKVLSRFSSLLELTADTFRTRRQWNEDGDE